MDTDTRRYIPPTAEEHARFLASFLFGGEMYPTLKDCVRRAYLDLSRTVYGINRDGVAKTLRRSSHDRVQRLLTEATQSDQSWRVESFDGWHHCACLQIIDHFREGGYPTFYVGQAQKWINMAIKYALTLQPVGMLSVAHAASLRQVAHVPIDNFILDALKPLGVKPIAVAWSRIDHYDEYMAYQNQIRLRFQSSTALDVEFREWISEARRRRISS